jgi:hypothetical protein
MKVKIGPYRNWVGPYQLAEMIPFVSEDTQWKIGEWLSETWVSDFCNWIDSKKQRKIDVRIDRYDVWSMDHTLALIILPMLKKLQEEKQGSPMVDDEDVPEHMRHSDQKFDENGWDMGDNWVHYKWEWVLKEMIWTFENLVDDSWESQFHHGQPEFNHVLVSGDGESEDSLYRLERVDNGSWFDKDGHKAYSDRIDNGLRLFGKYYRGLWS